MGNNFRKIMGVRGDSTTLGRRGEANSCACRSDNVESPKGDWPERAEARNVVESFTFDEKNFGNSAQATSCLCGEDNATPRDCIACGAERRLRELLESSTDEKATKLLDPSSRRSSSKTREASGEHPHSLYEMREESKNERSTSSEKKKKIRGLYERLEGLKSFCISGDCMERRRRTAQCACGRAGIYTYVIHS